LHELFLNSYIDKIYDDKNFSSFNIGKDVFKSIYDNYSLGFKDPARSMAIHSSMKQEDIELFFEEIEKIYNQE